MITLFALQALAAPDWTARTPIGEARPEQTDVRVQTATVELQVLDRDQVQVRVVYLLDNPGEKAIVRLAVPITSGGEQGDRASTAAASVRFLDATEAFVPCLVRPSPTTTTLPVVSARGANRVDQQCTADVVVPAGISSLRASYEGELLFDEADARVPTADRSLVYLLDGLSGWDRVEQLDVAIALGPFAETVGDVPAPMVAEPGLITASWSKPKPAELGPLVVPLGGAEALRSERVLSKTRDPAATVHRMLSDGDAATTRCGPTRVRWDEASTCGATLWTLPAVDLDVVACESREDRVRGGEPGVVDLLEGGTCYEVRPREGACLAELVVTPGSCPTPTPER